MLCVRFLMQVVVEQKVLCSPDELVLVAEAIERKGIDKSADFPVGFRSHSVKL